MNRLFARPATRHFFGITRRWLAFGVVASALALTACSGSSQPDVMQACPGTMPTENCLEPYADNMCNTVAPVNAICQNNVWICPMGYPNGGLIPAHCCANNGATPPDPCPNVVNMGPATTPTSD